MNKNVETDELMLFYDRLIENVKCRELARELLKLLLVGIDIAKRYKSQIE